MDIRKITSRGLLFGASAAAALSLAGIAAAHVGTEPGSVEAGAGATIGFRIGHGCDGSPTISVKMQIPDGVVGVRPQQLAGWEIDTVVGPITPYDSHGTTISEGVKEITWSGGSLPDSQFEVFTIRATIPDVAGETLYFPVVQECEEGEHAWIEIPKEGQSGDDLESPAPAVKVVASAGESDGHGASTDTQLSAETSASANGDGGGNGLAWIALGVGVLGLVAGAGGLASGLRKR